MGFIPRASLISCVETPPHDISLIMTLTRRGRWVSNGPTRCRRQTPKRGFRHVEEASRGVALAVFQLGLFPRSHADPGCKELDLATRGRSRAALDGPGVIIWLRGRFAPSRRSRSCTTPMGYFAHPVRCSSGGSYRRGDALFSSDQRLG
jgi:hypothetical protein